jgi:hypothetical protein
MITKDQLIKALYSAAKQIESDDGVQLSVIFEDQADAVLDLLSSSGYPLIPSKEDVVSKGYNKATFGYYNFRKVLKECHKLFE